jgi:D-beta-D-heptose 7-phosphate kinase/D-beta-D-heptose 1-phosphate adenosyltransferase
MLADIGLNTSAITTDETRPTTTKTRIVAHSQQVVRIDHELARNVTDTVEDTLLDRVAAAIPFCRACVLSDYGKGVVTPRFAQSLITLCRDSKVPVIVDPKGVDYRKYRGAHLVKPNLLEAGKVLNRDLRDQASIDRAGRDLCEFLGEDTSVLITQGAAGMTLFEPRQIPWHTPAFAREVFDVTGAGDTVAATLALAWAAGATLPEACRLASTAAAVVVAKAGTATVSLEELQAGLQTPPETKRMAA